MTVEPTQSVQPQPSVLASLPLHSAPTSSLSSTVLPLPAALPKPCRFTLTRLDLVNSSLLHCTSVLPRQRKRSYSHRAALHYIHDITLRIPACLEGKYCPHNTSKAEDISFNYCISAQCTLYLSVPRKGSIHQRSSISSAHPSLARYRLFPQPSPETRSHLRNPTCAGYESFRSFGLQAFQKSLVMQFRKEEFS